MAATACYFQTLRYDFVFDDEYFITNNPAVQSLSRPWRFFIDGSTYAHGARFYIYRPLATLSFAFNYAVGGLNPTGYHLVNILFHATNALLLYLVLMQMFGRRGLALVAGLVFALHPVQTEAVTWVAGRGNVLFVFFMLLGLGAHVSQFRQTGRKRLVQQVLAGGTYLLALLSKEHAIVLPGIFFLYELLFVGSRCRGSWWRRGAYYAALAVVMGGYLVARHAVLGQSEQRSEFWGGSLYATTATMAVAGLTYLRLMVWPAWLRVVYEPPVFQSFRNVPVLAALAVELVILAVGFINWRRAPIFTFAVGWMVFGFLPVSNLLPLDAIINERFMYLSMAGFAILVGFLFDGAAERLATWRAPVRGSPAFIVALLLLLCAGFTVKRNLEWRNTRTLFASARPFAPTDDKVLRNVGLGYMREGNFPQAAEAFQQLLLYHPKMRMARNELAAALMQMGRMDEAERQLLRSLEEVGQLEQAGKPVTPNSLVYANLAKIRVVKGDLDGAKVALESALAVALDDPLLKQDLAQLAQFTSMLRAARDRRTQGSAAETVAAYNRALAVMPYAASVRLELAETYLTAGRTGEGFQQLVMVLESNADDASAWQRLTEIAGSGRLDPRAVPWLEARLKELPAGHALAEKLNFILRSLRTES